MEQEIFIPNYDILYPNLIIHKLVFYQHNIHWLKIRTVDPIPLRYLGTNLELTEGFCPPDMDTIMNFSNVI